MSHDPVINSVKNLTVIEILKIENFTDKMLALGFATL